MVFYGLPKMFYQLIFNTLTNMNQKLSNKLLVLASSHRRQERLCVSLHLSFPAWPKQSHVLHQSGRGEQGRAAWGAPRLPLQWQSVCTSRYLIKSNINIEETMGFGRTAVQASTLPNLKTMLLFGRPLWF